MIDTATLVTTTLVQAVVNTAVVFIFKRTIGASAIRLTKLETKVEQQQEKRLEDIEGELKHAKESRGILYREKVSVGDCEKEHRQIERKLELFDNTVLRLERVSQKTDQAVERLESLQVQQYSLANKLAAVDERVNDLRKPS